MTKIFLDTNVILDLLIPGREGKDAAQGLLDLREAYLVVAATSVKQSATHIASIRACFAEVNQMAADDGIDITLLDLKYCSEDFLELKEKLYKKVRESKGQLMFDGDDGYHWVPNIGTPMTIDSVKSELLTGDQAQAEVWLKDKRGNKGYLEMTLYLENGAWKVHNWIDTDVYPFGALFNWMQNFYDDPTADAEEHEETDLSNYAE